MRPLHLAAILATSAALAACGGGSSGNVPQFNSPPQFSSLVSFGDSLSDVGTYAVGTVKALGGGKYTVNASDAKIWIEHLATRLNVSAPCAAQTGLEGDSTLGFSVQVTNHANCTAYAQGGARVTNPVGPGNKALGGANTVLGQLTVPVATQIQNHLTAKGGRFSGNEIVFVMAGGNDVFIQAATVSATVSAGGDQAVAAAAAVTAMATAGAELAGYVKNQIVGKGARYVTVVNLPDISKTPAFASDTGSQALITNMVTTFNTQLQQGLTGAEVLLIDAYTVSRDQNANPSRYGLSNVTVPACDLSLAKNPLASSLVCTRSNLIAGANDNFQYADGVHPTPYGYKLLADLVATEMGKRGWL
ncbi:MAG TPA: SGNH/GDSL hydrolase family protein [Noviherbaspirillum sp.]|nr:SGNH/GDSL hydrolase family protein [Noviherbaspirillum sp.]